ncbi:MAG: radical SAM protein [Elusimicrobia bacterium]|nr:radical SAM protein [Elusimicrobiota bacterium]
MRTSSNPKRALAALVQMPGWGVEAPPYSLACLAAYIKQNTPHSAKCFDFNLRCYRASPALARMWDDKDLYSLWEDDPTVERLFQENRGLFEACARELVRSGAQLIGFTTHTTSWRLSLKMAELVKSLAPDRFIVFGGPQCSLAQAGLELARHPCVDATSTGEGELVLSAILDSIAATGKLPRLPGLVVKDGKGGVKNCGPSPFPVNLDHLPYPDYSDFAREMSADVYKNPARIEILDSRGCPTRCNFCSEWQFWHCYRSMSGERVYAEAMHQLRQNPRAGHIYFIGSLMNGNPAALEKFCDLALAGGLKFTWEGQAKVHPRMTPELVSKMARSGCNWLGIGIESGSERLRSKHMHKSFTNANALDFLKACKESGIKTQINIMFGHPGETREDFNETLKFLLQARPFIDSVLASQSFCVLDKHTELYNRSSEFGIGNREHHLFWHSDGGRNTYLERFRRYEEFCKLALFLGLPESSGVARVKPDKWFMLGEYFRHIKDFRHALTCYRRSYKRENMKETAARHIDALSRELKLPRPDLPADKTGEAPRTQEAKPSFDPEFRARNLALNEKEFAERALVLESTPRFVTLGTHWKCNARCVFCQQDDLPLFNPGIYDSLFDRKLGPALRGAEKISFVGFGELLLMPEVESFLDRLNAELPDTWKIFTTNGSPLRMELDKRFLQGNYSLQISLHAPYAALHKELTGLDRFNEITASIRRLSALRLEHGRQRNLHLSLVCVLNEKNIDCLPEMAAFASGLGVQELRCEYMTVFRPELVPLSCYFFQKRTNRALDSARAMTEQLRAAGMDLKLPPSFGDKTATKPYESGQKGEHSVCDDPWRHIYVEAQGTSLPCCFWGAHSGDLNRQSFQELWNGTFYRRLRQAMAEGKPLPTCASCVRLKGNSIDRFETHMTARGALRAQILKAAKRMKKS